MSKSSKSEPPRAPSPSFRLTSVAAAVQVLVLLLVGERIDKQTRQEARKSGC